MEGGEIGEENWGEFWRLWKGVYGENGQKRAKMAIAKILPRLLLAPVSKKRAW